LLKCLKLTCREIEFYSSLAVDVQWLQIVYSHCATKLISSKDLSNTQVATFQLTALEQVFLEVNVVSFLYLHGLFQRCNQYGTHIGIRRVLCWFVPPIQ
jgi:hypothetical protein